MCPHSLRSVQWFSLTLYEFKLHNSLEQLIKPPVLSSKKEEDEGTLFVSANSKLKQTRQ